MHLLRCVYNKGAIDALAFFVLLLCGSLAFNPKTCWKGLSMVWRTHFSKSMAVEGGDVIMSFHDPALRHVFIVLCVKQTAFTP